MIILYMLKYTPLSGTFYDYSPYGLGKTPDCPVTKNWTGFMRMKKVKSNKTDMVRKSV